MSDPVVLIVDDDASARDTIDALLACEPYERVTAENGRQALELVEVVTPDVILLDVMMPEMDGYEVCARLKARKETREVPIIMVTALAAKEDMVRGLEVGADEFLTKPVGGLELRARVRSMLRIKRLFDELEESMKLRDDLARMIVHDMRSPLTGIIGFAELLKMSADNPENVEMLDDILSQAQRLNAFANDLLMLAKMEEGRLRAHCTPVEVDRLMRSAARPYEAMARTRGGRFELIMPDEPDLVLQLDEALLPRVLDNLLSNAFKYSPSSSTVGLEVRCRRPQPGAAVSDLVLRVRDEGPGIPEAHRSRIFEKFETLRMRHHGVQQTGLGLAFARLAVEAHGGRIWVEDNQPKGSVFVVELPVSGELAEAEETLQYAPTPS